MNFDDRVAAVGIANQFQECSKEVYKMVEEETDTVKTQVILLLGSFLVNMLLMLMTTEVIMMNYSLADAKLCQIYAFPETPR